jgi:hypothetical protein
MYDVIIIEAGRAERHYWLDLWRRSVHARSPSQHCRGRRFLMDRSASVPQNREKFRRLHIATMRKTTNRPRGSSSLIRLVLQSRYSRGANRGGQAISVRRDRPDIKVRLRRIAYEGQSADSYRLPQNPN